MCWYKLLLFLKSTKSKLKLKCWKIKKLELFSKKSLDLLRKLLCCDPPSANGYLFSIIICLSIFSDIDRRSSMNIRRKTSTERLGKPWTIWPSILRFRGSRVSTGAGRFGSWAYTITLVLCRAGCGPSTWFTPEGRVERWI